MVLFLINILSYADIGEDIARAKQILYNLGEHWLKLR